MSVRVRVTAVAVVVTAVALAIGGWGLLRTIERTQLGRIAAASEEQVDLVATRLAQGVPAERVRILADLSLPTASFVQVLDNATGAVLSSSPGAFSEPIFVIDGDVIRSADGGVQSGTAVAGQAGGARVVESFPDQFNTPVELDLRYRSVETPNGDVTVVAASPLDEVNRSLDAVRRSLWYGLPLVVALLGAVAWFVTGRALHPVEAMRAEADAITHSTLHRRVPEPAAVDEVGRLARTLNAMLDRLEGSAERQRRFVADASHELRTPVATLRAELEVALRSGDEAELRRGVEAALVEEDRLESLLADLLLLASLEDAPLARAEPVDLGALVAAEAERRRAVPVTVTGHGIVPGAPRPLERVITNLLDNAARHARSTVVATIDGGELVVEDDGPGIPAADRERVFERFTRLDEGRARDAGGSGLGLSIVRAAVDAHGGTVTIDESPTLGGARFTVRLPGGGAEVS